MPAPRPSRVFVYGNLMPGWHRWPALRPYARTIRVDAVAGRIYDTGTGRPAAVFGGETRIEGWVVELHRHLAERALADVRRLLGDDFREVVLRTIEGGEVVAYEWGGSVDGLKELPGRWRDPERRTG